MGCFPPLRLARAAAKGLAASHAPARPRLMQKTLSSAAVEISDDDRARTAVDAPIPSHFRRGEHLLEAYRLAGHDERGAAQRRGVDHVGRRGAVAHATVSYLKDDVLRRRLVRGHLTGHQNALRSRGRGEGESRDGEECADCGLHDDLIPSFS